MSDHCKYQLSLNTVHIGSKVTFNEQKIRDHGRGAFIPLYKKECEDMIVTHIQFHYHEIIDETDIQCLLKATNDDPDGGYWFKIEELEQVKSTNTLEERVAKLKKWKARQGRRY